MLLLSPQPSFLSVSIRNLNCLRANASGCLIKDFENDVGGGGFSTTDFENDGERKFLQEIKVRLPQVIGENVVDCSAPRDDKREDRYQAVRAHRCRKNKTPLVCHCLYKPKPSFINFLLTKSLVFSAISTAACVSFSEGI